MPIETFDLLTNKRINRIIKIQEKRLEERQKMLDKQREEQEHEARIRQARENRKQNRMKF